MRQCKCGNPIEEKHKKLCPICKVVNSQESNYNYYIQNKVKWKKYCKKYYIKNKDKIKVRQKDYINSPKGQETKRRYYEKNKEKLQKYKAKYNKEKTVDIYFAGKHVKVFTNGVTEEIKPLIPKIKNKVFEDCIKNPRKYLDS